jgi:predicted metal-dependent hydrolase
MEPRRRETILQGGRAKAYRPLDEATRKAALSDGLEAYARGDFFLAHEILEPAWMGTADPGERDLLQGLIKLSAAFVHSARSNPIGIAKNLRGARDRFQGAITAGRRAGIDVPTIAGRIDERLAALTGDGAEAEAAAVAPAIDIVRLPPAP